MSTATTLLTVDGLDVAYGNAAPALRQVTLSVGAGQVVALFGANGAGKSTTLRAITNLLQADRGRVLAGSVRFDGEEIIGRDTAELVTRGIAQVLEGRRLFSRLTVEENLRAGGYAVRHTHKASSDLDLVYHYFPKLRERRRQQAGYLSGGEQQMVAIGRALMARPRLILLDEPSMGLAPLLVKEIFNIIHVLSSEQKVAILLAEQNVRRALSIITYGYVLEDGRIAHEGAVTSLAADANIQRFYLGLGSTQAAAEVSGA